jgi:hypothetical protein
MSARYIEMLHGHRLLSIIVDCIIDTLKFQLDIRGLCLFISKRLGHPEYHLDKSALPSLETLLPLSGICRLRTRSFLIEQQAGN